MKLANLEEGESIPNTPPGGKGGGGAERDEAVGGGGVSERKMEPNLQRKAGGGERKPWAEWMDG